MISKEPSVNRVHKLFFDEMERRDSNFVIVAKEFNLGKANVLVQCWTGSMMIPISFVPGIARFLGVDPAWLLRIYLEDSLPDTMKMIEQCGLSILLTERERDLVLAYRRSTAGEDPPMTVTDDGQISFEVRAVLRPGE